MRQRNHQRVTPSARDRTIAREASAGLAQLAQLETPLTLELPHNRQPVDLPAAAIGPLRDILDAIAAGLRVEVISERAELTTVQAAKVLNVSRPFLVNLLDEGAIPHRKVGTHRRVLLEDVLAYKERDDREREAILDQLAREAQEQGMGYGQS